MSNDFKSYYLPPIRSVIAGTIFILIGISISMIGLDFEKSFSDNIQSVLLDFSGIANFIASLLLLVVKIGMITVGIFYLKNLKNILRARIDSKGLYYKKKIKNRYSFLTYEIENLKFIPFNAILDISLEKNILWGDQIKITDREGEKLLLSIGTLRNREKQEIVDVIKSKINKTKANNVTI